MKLTAQELEELAALEEENASRLEEEADNAKRQHLDALRMAKKLSAKHGVPGRDFLVLETKLGNIAIRRPIDVEVDTMDENADREKLEAFALPLVIEPKREEVQAMMAQHPSLTGALVMHASKMLKVVREEDSKK